MRWMTTLLAALVIAAAMTQRQASVPHAAPLRQAAAAVAIRSCNESGIRTFLSGWIQGRGDFPGGADFVCREIGVGPSTEALVYLAGPLWCGSGGCRLLVLAPEPDVGYIVVGHVATVRLPIRVLKNRTHGRNDLVVFVEGGGVIPGYNARLAYDGKSYPISGYSGTELPDGSQLGAVVISISTPTSPM